MTFADAITHFEGYDPRKPLSRPVRNNNPGDLEFHEWMTISYPGTRVEDPVGHGTPRFAHYPTLAVGRQALANLLIKNYLGKTVHAALNIYAPPIENDTSAYEGYVCGATGLSPTHLITPDDCFLTATDPVSA